MSIAEVFDFLRPLQNLVVIFVVKKIKLLLLLRKDGSGDWDRTNDQSAMPGHT
tara:strand:+ start:862 stop:1020 length:159 start_codon:yes stop_codon:yes gene_type:complete